MFEFARRPTYFVRLVEGQTHLRTSWHAKMSLTLNEPILLRKFFFLLQTSTLLYYPQACTANL